MINIKECKKLLKEEGKGFTDAEIRELMEILNKLAEVEYRNYIK